MARAAADGGVLCAEQDGELTGVAAFRTEGGETTLTQLHVDPVHWRSGTGAALHAACLEAWRRAGIHRVRLEVYEHNLRAQAFYAAHGWRPDPPPPDRRLPPHPVALGGADVRGMRRRSGWLNQKLSHFCLISPDPERRRIMRVEIWSVV